MPARLRPVSPWRQRPLQWPAGPAKGPRCRERHERHPIGKVGGHPVGQLERQTRFSGPRWADQCHQARHAEQPFELLEVGLATNQRVERPRHDGRVANRVLSRGGVSLSTRTPTLPEGRHHRRKRLLVLPIVVGLGNTEPGLHIRSIEAVEITEIENLMSPPEGGLSRELGVGSQTSDRLEERSLQEGPRASGAVRRRRPNNATQRMRLQVRQVV